MGKGFVGAQDIHFGSRGGQGRRPGKLVDENFHGVGGAGVNLPALGVPPLDLSGWNGNMAGVIGD